jgi:uncharacterized pyridoxal phosphate-containing UPF0001 family protein
VAAVRDRIARAAGAAGRDPASVELLAVSKLHPAEAVAAACRAGVRQVGENYAQEMVAKMEALAGDAACASLAWHFIGRLQRNKAKLVAGRAALIHAVDSIELASEIARRAGGATAALPLPVLSMGTTVDLEVAVAEGATLVRVGTAIFGRRPGGDD